MNAWKFLPFFIASAACCFGEMSVQPVKAEGSEIAAEFAGPAVAAPRPANRDEWEKQKEFFKKNGYLWIKNFFSAEQMRLLQDWVDEINAASQNILKLTHNAGKPGTLNIPGTLIIVPEARDPSLVCRAEDTLSLYPDLHHFIAGTLSSYIGRLLGEPYVLFKDKINFKWPGGGAFEPHQDFPAYENFGPREHVTAMVCIDPATLENGCLQVAKNWTETFAGDANVSAEKLKTGHAVIPYVTGGKSHGSIQPQYSEKISWLALETAPGDLVLMDSFVPHYSEPNRSQKPRRAFFFTHNRLKEGDHRKAYYHAKREDPNNPVFHFATPTNARTK